MKGPDQHGPGLWRAIHTKGTDMDVRYATATAHVGTPDGGKAMVVKGQHWPASDPVVRQNPSLFSTDPRWGLTFSSQPDGFDAPVEQATAAPGEKRNTRRG